MNYRAVMLASSVFLGVGFLLGATSVFTQSDRPVVYRAPGGTVLRLLVDEQNLGGGEVSVGEMTFPAGLDSGDHTHGSIEIFYVISGELEHVVNGQSQVLKPGMAGFVRPPDRVRHRVGATGPAKAVVIWAPGDEAGRIVSRWRREP